MATRSRIGIENEDGTVSSVYCHWDGYPSGNGRTLVEYYSDREKVKELIALGSISTFVFTVAGLVLILGRLTDSIVVPGYTSLMLAIFFG